MFADGLYEWGRKIGAVGDVLFLAAIEDGLSEIEKRRVEIIERYENDGPITLPFEVTWEQSFPGVQIAAELPRARRKRKAVKTKC